MAVAQQVGDLDQRSSTSMTLRQIRPGWDASQYTEQQRLFPLGRPRSPGRDERDGDGRRHMARIFITGSAGGLRRAAAQTLLGEGHEVIIHARSAERLAAVNDLIGRGASAVVGEL